MGKIDARTIYEKQKKNIMIAFAIMFFLLIVIMIVLHVFSQNTKKVELTYENLKTVEEVLIYYECEYIYEKKSDLEEYNTDIKLVFRYDLYDGDVSNEEFFNDVIKDIARVLGYSNFRMIDEEKDIEIKVKCSDYKVSEIIINDIPNYFIYMNSQKDLEKYVVFEEKELQIEAPEILNLINNNWSSDVSFGTRESIFDNYYKYFDEGISTRTISGKIYNIVFNKKYPGNIVNGIFPGVENNSIKAKLGEPTFEDEELNVIGYKSKDIYVFFTEDEISVYRVADVDTSDFFKLVDKLLSDELDLLDFMNELTYLWPDYSDYEYTSDSVFLSYPLKGIDVKIGYENTNAIVLYNNVKSNLTIIKKYLENAEFVSRLGADNLFEAEKRRLEESNSLLKKCEEYVGTLTENEKNKIGESLRFGNYAELDGDGNIIKLCFISRDGANPNRELYDSISSYLWFDSDVLIYSQNQKGIFTYNVITGQKGTLVAGDETYNLNSFENGVLKYDDSELIIQY